MAAEDARMNRRTLLVLVVLFVAMGIIALLQAQQGPPPLFDSQATLESFRWMGQTLNMSLNDIAAIRLRAPQSNLTFTISRDSSGTWSAPGSPGNLDQTAASGIAKTITLLPYSESVELTPSTRLEDFGFRPEGSLALEIVLQSGQTHAIAVGDLTPDQLAYYALADNLPQVFVLERGAIDYLRQQLNKPPLT